MLRSVLQSPRAELIIVYGRRGVGKSALLEHALAGSGIPYIFYRATRRTLRLQLDALTDATREAFPDAFLPQPFASVAVFLEYLTHLSGLRADGSAALAVVIDELPYLADVEPGLLTTLQHWWDASKRRSPNLKIFLAGSYVAFMERQVLDVSAPLYNRRTGAMRLEPLSYFDAARFFPAYSLEDRMTAYAILGGLPSYLEQWDTERGIEENVKATILRRNTYLSEEPDWLLLEDLRKDITYGSILRAIAQGARRPSDIARAIGKSSAQDITQPLSTLRELDLVAREVPLTEKRDARARNSLYFLADSYLDFWYRFVDPARSLVARGLGQSLWERRIAPSLSAFVSRPCFERACRQWVWRALETGVVLPGDLAERIADVGTWWGAGDKEIDVVAADERGAVTLAGSCKWTNAPVDVSEYAALQSDIQAAVASGSLPLAPDLWLALFSRSGFTDRLRALAARQEPPRLLLIDLPVLYDTDKSL